MRSGVVPVLIAALVAAPAHAQRSDITADEALENSARVYGPTEPPRMRRCDPDETEDPEVIVVCRQLEEQSQFRVPSSTDRGENLDDGIPRAENIPGIAGPGIFTGPPTVGGLCTPGSCPPPMPVMIDLEAIPEAPAGSDADRVARGEKRVD